MIKYCHRMDSKGWVANHDGNITVKLPNGNFVATPTARSKADLQVTDLLLLGPDGKKIDGKGEPFSELSIHLKIYTLRPEVMAVIHAHPPSATAVGCANQEMMTGAIPEAVISLGPGVPLVGLSLPNSAEFWKEFDPLVAHYDSIMIGGNGVFSCGKSLEQAFLRMELTEHVAHIMIQSLPLGGPKLLEPEQLTQLLKKRAQTGLALPPDSTRPNWFPR